MKISVIVPTYKPQGYLWECLNSIYNQTFSKSDYELVLVLNGCNEPFNAQIEDWLGKHSDLQVQFFQTDEGGVSNARNIALDNAKGEYITFIDDDDLVSPMYLQELFENATPDTISLCYPYAFNDGKIEVQLPYGITDAYNYCIGHKCDKLASRVRKFFSGPCMKLIPISFIQDRRFDVRFKNGEDSLFMFLISDKIKKFAFTSKDAVYYRRYRDNSAYTRSKTKREIIANKTSLIKAYISIYLRRPQKYSLLFFITRLLGTLR